jgi:AraC family transcriptional regulator of adaptative response/methylated-DNA-[protein]-cysteine methyltransferase
MIYSKIINTPIGKMLVGSVDEGVFMLEFVDNEDAVSVLHKLAKQLNETITEGYNNHIISVEKQLNEYFEGKRNSFSVPLYLIGTDFQKRVWSYLQKIEFGKTKTYTEQALALGDLKAIRAVASANGANKIPILIPCHRVVGAKGSLTGYSGGLWRKKYLLEHESHQYKLNL